MSKEELEEREKLLFKTDFENSGEELQVGLDKEKNEKRERENYKDRKKRNEKEKNGGKGKSITKYQHFKTTEKPKIKYKKVF